MAALEGMTVQIYSPKCSSEDVNEVRKLLFITSLKPLESIPQQNMHCTNMSSVLFFWGWVWNKRLENLDAPLDESYRS